MVGQPTPAVPAAPTVPSVGSQGAGGSGDQKSPPFGSSPATQPTQNKGMEMAGLQKLGLVVRGLEQILPLVGSNSPVGQDVLSTIKSLSKHIPPGSVTPAAERNQLEEMARKNAQGGQQMQQMKQMMAGGGGGAPGAPPAAMPPPGAGA